MVWQEAWQLRTAALAEIDWKLLTDLGQAFGTISGLLSAIALLGVLASFRLQRQQTRVAQLESVRNIRMQLLLFGMERPRFLRLWGYDGSDFAGDPQETAYCSMIFAYLKMAFLVGLLTEFELAKTCAGMFHDPVVRTFWEQSRVVYLSDHFTPESRRFARLVNSWYEVTAVERRAARGDGHAPAGPGDAGSRSTADGRGPSPDLTV